MTFAPTDHVVVDLSYTKADAVGEINDDDFTTGTEMAVDGATFPVAPKKKIPEAAGKRVRTKKRTRDDETGRQKAGKGEEDSTEACFSKPLFLLALDIVLHGTEEEVAELCCGDLQKVNLILESRWEQASEELQAQLMDQVALEARHTQSHQLSARKFLATIGWKKNKP